MLIWSLMAIPVIAIVVLILGFSKKIAIWEYFLIFFIPMIAIAITKYMSVDSQVRDIECWNSYLVDAQYTEYWSTWVRKTCEECVARDTSGRCTRYRKYDCSYCDENQPSWSATDNLGNTHHINSTQFEEICRKWGMRNKVELNRSINYHKDWCESCGQDGDQYVTSYNNKFESTVPLTNEHTYTNKVQNSRSIFNFKPVDTSEVRMYALYDYCHDFNEFNYNPIYGDDNKQAVDRLNWWNAHLGSIKQVHMNILIFRNQSVMAAEYQKAYWKGGNKNEFILCIGIDNNSKIQWAKVISWTEVEILKLKLERDIPHMEYDLPKIIDVMGNEVQKGFVRKQFADFNYIRVEPTTGAIISAFVVVIILTIGLVVFSIKNDFDLKN